MLFVSRHQNYQTMIWQERVRVVTYANGSADRVTDVPLFEAKFHAGRLTEVERRAAARMFSMSITGLTDHDSRGVAQPYREDGVIIGAVGASGDAYSGYDPQWHMSSFDTDADIPYSELGCFTTEEKQAAKQACEDRLASSPDIPSSLVRVDERTVPAPWPTYNKIRGAGAAKKIAALTESTGILVDDVIAFEAEIGKRDDVLAELAELKARQVEDAARDAIEQASLQVTVG